MEHALAGGDVAAAGEDVLARRGVGQGGKSGAVDTGELLGEHRCRPRRQRPAGQHAQAAAALYLVAGGGIAGGEQTAQTKGDRALRRGIGDIDRAHRVAVLEGGGDGRAVALGMDIFGQGQAEGLAERHGARLEGGQPGDDTVGVVKSDHGSQRRVEKSCCRRRRLAASAWRSGSKTSRVMVSS